MTSPFCRRPSVVLHSLCATVGATETCLYALTKLVMGDKPILDNAGKNRKYEGLVNDRELWHCSERSSH